MIPLRDHNPSRTTPYVVFAIIALNALGFFVELSHGLGRRSGGIEAFVGRYGVTPAYVVRYLKGDRSVMVEAVHAPRPGWEALFGPRREVREIPLRFLDVFLPLLTSMFLHGGWMHIIGNLWFLWIFGDNVEDRFGHGPFTAFYLGGGVIASIAHVLTNPSSAVPTIGASGAISAVLGAYLVLFPRARVLALVPLGFFLTTVDLPAKVFLGFWFIFQLIPGLTSLGAQAATGVAFWAHIGGFLFGAGVAALLGRPPDRDPLGRYVPYRILP